MNITIYLKLFYSKNLVGTSIILLKLINTIVIFELKVSRSFFLSFVCGNSMTLTALLYRYDKEWFS